MKNISLGLVFCVGALLFLSGCGSTKTESDLSVFPDDDSLEISMQKIEEVKKLFAKKYNTTENKASVTITTEQDEFLRGNYEILGISPKESGLYFATKVSGEWQLVYTGGNSYNCADVKQYNFPASMIIDCK